MTEGVPASNLNVWGTDRSMINEDEYCPDCERAVPCHYNNCPRRVIERNDL